MSTSRVMNRRRTNHDNTQDSMTDYKQKEEANAAQWQIHKKKSFTEQMFGIRRTSTLGRNHHIEQETKTGPIDEVDGLC